MDIDTRMKVIDGVKDLLRLNAITKTRAISGGVEQLLEVHHLPENRWILWNIVTDSSSAAVMDQAARFELTKWGTDRADDQGVPCDYIGMRLHVTSEESIEKAAQSPHLSEIYRESSLRETKPLVAMNFRPHTTKTVRWSPNDEPHGIELLAFRRKPRNYLRARGVGSQALSTPN